MDRQTRISRIVEIVKEKNGESIKGLASRLDVTEMTIRRDIAQLKASRLVKVVSGAVLYDGNTFSESGGIDKYDLLAQKSRHTAEKYRIGKLAASLVAPDDIIYIDIGTTASNIIQHISSSLPVTIVCCTMNALMEIQKRGADNTILIGGMYRSDVQLFESREGVELLGRTRITKAFISAAGVNAKLGATCVNSYEVDTKGAAMRSAVEKILVIDSSKFDVVKPAFFAALGDFDAVVTDSALSTEWREYLEAVGIRLYLA